MAKNLHLLSNNMNQSVLQKNEEGEYHGKSYRSIKELNGKTFIEFVDGASLNFFCERIEEFIQI